MRYCKKCDKYYDNEDYRCPVCHSIMYETDGEINPNSTGAKQPDEDQIQYREVPDYLVWSILSTIFCCTIGGIVSIVYSVQANTKKQDGKYQEAENLANKAKNWLIFNVVAGLVAAVIAVIGTQINR